MKLDGLCVGWRESSDLSAGKGPETVSKWLDASRGRRAEHCSEPALQVRCLWGVARVESVKSVFSG
jgi:hypothetical protein